MELVIDFRRDPHSWGRTVKLCVRHWRARGRNVGPVALTGEHPGICEDCDRSRALAGDRAAALRLGIEPLNERRA